MPDPDAHAAALLHGEAEFALICITGLLSFGIVGGNQMVARSTIEEAIDRNGAGPLAAIDIADPADHDLAFAGSRKADEAVGLSVLAAIERDHPGGGVREHHYSSSLESTGAEALCALSE